MAKGLRQGASRLASQPVELAYTGAASTRQRFLTINLGKRWRVMQSTSSKGRSSQASPSECDGRAAAPATIMRCDTTSTCPNAGVESGFNTCMHERYSHVLACGGPIAAPAQPSAAASRRASTSEQPRRPCPCRARAHRHDDGLRDKRGGRAGHKVGQPGRAGLAGARRRRALRHGALHGLQRGQVHLPPARTGASVLAAANGPSRPLGPALPASQAAPCRTPGLRSAPP